MGVASSCQSCRPSKPKYKHTAIMSQEGEQFNHIDVQKYKEQKSPYKDELAEEQPKKQGALHHAVTGTVGNVVGGVTKPVLGPIVGGKDEKMEALGGENKDSYVHGKDTVGGHMQTADNPLGLNQTGSDKFRD